MAKINDSDLRLVLLGCFRYSLGRMTYMPSVTVSAIKNNPELFNETDWERFIEEIDECDRLGMECDVKTWTDFREYCEKQLGGKE